MEVKSPYKVKRYTRPASNEAGFFMPLINRKIKQDMYYNEETIIYFNGAFAKAADAKMDLYSQSLHYGYAVFEGIKSYKTDSGIKIFKAKEHYDRLRHSAQVMQMPFDTSTEELTRLTYEVLERNNFSDAYIRPVVFCSPNMALSKGKETYLAITAWEWTNGYLANKMRLMTSSWQRPNPGAFHIEAKVSGHYVNSILACQEAKDKGFDEALLLDMNGFVAEGPGANIFFEKDGTLFTPSKGNILPGITRATVIEICRELNIPVTEKLFTPQEMHGADAAFYCGTAAEVVQLDSLDNIPFVQPWEQSLSSQVQQAYSRLTKGLTVKVNNEENILA
jgi:branched-chain amino acid aminotransferase